MDFFEKGYIIKENISQYWDCSDIYPTCKLYEIAQFGGFKAAYETNISTSGNKMVISLKIIFYDNTTTDEKIIVDIDLGEIIE